MSPPSPGVCDKDPPDVLNKRRCLEYLAALRHAKWFQVTTLTHLTTSHASGEHKGQPSNQTLGLFVLNFVLSLGSVVMVCVCGCVCMCAGPCQRSSVVCDHHPSVEGPVPTSANMGQDARLGEDLSVCVSVSVCLCLSVSVCLSVDRKSVV